MAQKLVRAEVPRRVLYRVEEAVALLGLSRSQLYEQLLRDRDDGHVLGGQTYTVRDAVES